MLISLCLTSTALATTWTVDDDGLDFPKADFDNIQAAVDAALDGDEIIVMPGTYTGTGDEVVDMLGKSLVLRSNGESELTIIDGEHSRRGISVDDKSPLPHVIVIEGFTIINCSFSNNYGSGIGGFCTDSTININSCHFKNNEGYLGGGLLLQADVVSITNCTFSKNSAFQSGGGAACTGTNIEISECVF
ncbi:MAG: right-handed parallel beta-helix repeat-containing protein, partial [Anaerolineales bacterium]|nr:right-handed parallel beta-helix repeat-containing protein [Anaerolineales bacterium]